MLVQVIQTPADLEWTLTAGLCRFNNWLPPPYPPETMAIERIIDRAFAEHARATFEGGSAELGMLGEASVVDCLDDLAGPLERLMEQGCQLVAVLSGTDDLDRTEGGLEMADYLLATDPCYFRPAGSAFAAPIHALGSDCPDGHALIVAGDPTESERAFEIWMSTEAVMRDFELSAPWCPHCMPDLGARGAP